MPEIDVAAVPVRKGRPYPTGASCTMSDDVAFSHNLGHVMALLPRS